MDKLTVKQAALALGISAQTVRRRIAKGQLPAKKEMTEFGATWLIPASIINVATDTVEVVSVTQPITPAEISQIIESAVAAQVEPLRAEIALLRSELANQTKALEASTGKQSAPLSKGFWQRLFGSHEEENHADKEDRSEKA